MSVALYLVCFLVGAGALALWVDVRFPSLMPGGMVGILVHLVAAFVVLQFGSGVIAPAVADFPVPGARLIAVIAVILPLLAYASLTALWALRLARDPMGAR
jgi:hypothetical protein